MARHEGYAKKQAYDAERAGRVSGEVPGTADYFGKRSRAREIQRQGALRRRDTETNFRRKYLLWEQDMKGASRGKALRETKQKSPTTIDPKMLAELREAATVKDAEGAVKINQRQYQAGVRAVYPDLANSMFGSPGSSPETALPLPASREETDPKKYYMTGRGPMTGLGTKKSGVTIVSPADQPAASTTLEDGQAGPKMNGNGLLASRFSPSALSPALIANIRQRVKAGDKTAIKTLENWIMRGLVSETQVKLPSPKVNQDITGRAAQFRRQLN